MTSVPDIPAGKPYKPDHSLTERINAETRRGEKVLEARRIAEAHCDNAVRGLNLSDQDDRTTFRTRLTDGYRMTKFSYMKLQAETMGVGARANRPAMIRAIAMQYITNADREDQA